MSKLQIDLSNLPKLMNQVQYDLLKCKTRYLVEVGGAGSGKSHGIAQRLIFRILLGIEKDIVHRFLCVRKTSPAVRHSIFTLFDSYINQWGLARLVSKNKTEMTFTFPNSGQILCRGLDDPEKVKSIEGITGIWCEEATELKENDIEQLNLRLRSPHADYEQVILSFNPIDELHFLKKNSPTRHEMIQRLYTQPTRIIDSYRRRMRHSLNHLLSTIQTITGFMHLVYGASLRILSIIIGKLPGKYYNPQKNTFMGLTSVLTTPL